AFFFQAEDGIRDYKVTGVQTCALPIFSASRRQVEFKTHFLGYVLVPGDPVEVSQTGLGLVKMPGIVHSLAEAGKKEMKVTVVERSEESRVGKECRRGGTGEHDKKKSGE